MQINLCLGNILDVDVDVIVNAANEKLMRGSGVCGAIHKAAGPALEIECASIGYCATGDVVLTNGYNLLTKKIIQAVGPVYNSSPNAPQLLASCYLKSLQLADVNGFRSIAFPCISTGIYGYPFVKAAQIALKTIKSYSPKQSLTTVTLCCFSKSDYQTYENLLKTWR